MCGRASLSVVDPDELEEALGLTDVPPMPARYNMAPSQPLPVVREPGRLEFVRWGLPTPQPQQTAATAWPASTSQPPRALRAPPLSPRRPVTTSWKSWRLAACRAASVCFREAMGAHRPRTESSGRYRILLAESAARTLRISRSNLPGETSS